MKLTETILRDAHQSLIATRMRIDEMLPALPLIDQIGFHSVECWGGATYDSCLRFLHEDPWERLRILRRELPHCKLQMLFRGQNMLGYRHYSDDTVTYFVQKIAANGMDIIRIFDALNDMRNLETAISAAKKEKSLHVQVAIPFTTGEIFTDDYFVKSAKEAENIGADSICLKDMAALLTPYRTGNLIHAIKKAVNIPVQLHTHSTSGLSAMCILKGAEAGLDYADTALSPLALGTSHTPTESIVAALQDTPYDTGLDLKKLAQLRSYFMKLRKKYLENGLLDPKLLAADASALLYQVPGGMLSNLLSQLKQAGKEEKFEEVLQEVPRVRKDAGEPPLVTPSSQIVGTQAALNIISGERYKMVTKEFREMIRGAYGRTPIPIDPEFQKKIIGDATPVICRPADLIEPELKKLQKECSDWMEQPEDVLSYAQFGQTALQFFRERRDKKFKIDSTYQESKIHPVL
ncbi:MAG: pyruvate carboxylase subunit B [Ruminococcus sp.]|nr:pyruvate carboxylase subunit B [Ruminococcus sp.]